jgi:hypothetical protein
MIPDSKFFKVNYTKKVVSIKEMFQIVGAKLKMTIPASHMYRVLFGKTVTFRMANMYSISTSSVRNGTKWAFPSIKPNILMPISEVAKSVTPAKDSIR